MLGHEVVQLFVFLDARDHDEIEGTRNRVNLGDAVDSEQVVGN